MCGPLDATPISTSPARDVGAREQRALLGHADEGAGDVERPGRVDAGHLGGLTAEHGAAGALARLGHAGDDLGDEVGVEAGRSDVVEEEQRSSGLHQHVVDAVVDDVRADPADPPETGGELHLRADAVGRRDEDRFAHRLRSPSR